MKGFGSKWRISRWKFELRIVLRLYFCYYCDCSPNLFKKLDPQVSTFPPIDNHHSSLYRNRYLGSDRPISAQMFHQFRKLPVELKRLVWQEYHDGDAEGRVVEVRWSKNNKRFFVDNPVPVLFHVCRESRQLVKKYYDTMILAVGVTNIDTHNLMAAQLGLPPKTGYTAPTCCLFRVFFSYERDTLYLSSNHFEDNNGGDHEGGVPLKLREFLAALNAQKKASQNLRALAISADKFDPDTIGGRIFNMAQLEYLYFVFGDNCCPTGHFHGTTGQTHKQAITFKHIEAPKLPVAKSPPLDPPIVNIPGLGSRRVGIRLSQIPGYPHFNARQDYIDELTREQERVLRIEERWQEYNEQLYDYLEDMVAVRVNGFCGDCFPREEWEDLETFAVEAVRC